MKSGKAYEKLLEISFIAFDRSRSETATKPARSTIAIMTTTVESTSSLYFFRPLAFGSGSQGHVALRSSPLTSPMNVEIFWNIYLLLFINEGVAGPERLELTTNGFGNHYSTN